MKMLSFFRLFLQVLENLHVERVCPQIWWMLWGTGRGLCFLLSLLWAREEEALGSPGSFCVTASLNSERLTFPLHPCVKDVGIHTGPCSHPRWSQHTWQLMPGTLSPLEEETSVILLTSPVCYSILDREPSCSLLTVHGNQEGKHRDHTNFAYLLSFKNLSKLPFCGSSAIVIQQWQQNHFKTTPFAVQVSNDHGIMESWKTKAQFRLESLTFMFEKNSFRGL